MMTRDFKRLCGQLKDKIERQKKLVDICRAQSRALRAHDYEYVGAKTIEFARILSASTQPEQELNQTLEELYNRFELCAEKRNLGDLLTAAPEPYREQLAEYEQSLHLFHIELVSLTHSSVMSMQRAAETIAECMISLHDCMSQEIESAENIIPLERHTALQAVC